jgi:hypothetical protein
MLVEIRGQAEVPWYIGEIHRFSPAMGMLLPREQINMQQKAKKNKGSRAAYHWQVRGLVL